MENDNINNVFAEVYDIICHTDYCLVNKIPRKFIKMLKENRNPNYNIDIDYKRNLVEQNILDDTKIMIGIIYKEFLVGDYTL